MKYKDIVKTVKDRLTLADVCLLYLGRAQTPINIWSLLTRVNGHPSFTNNRQDHNQLREVLEQLAKEREVIIEWSNERGSLVYRLPVPGDDVPVSRRLQNALESLERLEAADRNSLSGGGSEHLRNARTSIESALETLLKAS